jgi:hypothetical protein
MLEGNSGGVYSLSFSPDGKPALSGSSNEVKAVVDF